MSKNYKFLLVILLALSGFAFDLLIPLGVAAGIVYIPLVFCGLIFKDSKAILAQALLGTILTIIGYFSSPDIGSITWIVILNRIISIIVLWITAIVLY